MLIAIRPLIVLIAFVGSGTSIRERLFLGWFGVRGVGSLYYAAVAVAVGTLGAENEITLFWTVVVCSIVSIIAHGASASPLARRLLP